MSARVSAAVAPVDEGVGAVDVWNLERLFKHSSCVDPELVFVIDSEGDPSENDQQQKDEAVDVELS